MSVTRVPGGSAEEDRDCAEESLLKRLTTSMRPA